MTRLIAIALVVALAAPAASAASFGMDGVDLVGPEECCCPEHASEEPAPPQIENVCCCELRPANRGLELTRTAAVLEAELRVPPAALNTVDARVGTPASRPPVQSARARAPPPDSSLLSQHTSLLL